MVAMPPIYVFISFTMYKKYIFIQLQGSNIFPIFICNSLMPLFSGSRKPSWSALSMLCRAVHPLHIRYTSVTHPIHIRFTPVTHPVHIRYTTVSHSFHNRFMLFCLLPPFLVFPPQNASAVDGMQFLCHYYKDKGDYTRASKMANGLLDYTGTVRCRLFLFLFCGQHQRTCKLHVFVFGPPRQATNHKLRCTAAAGTRALVLAYLCNKYVRSVCAGRPLRFHPPDTHPPRYPLFP